MAKKNQSDNRDQQQPDRQQKGRSGSQEQSPEDRSDQNDLGANKTPKSASTRQSVGRRPSRSSEQER